MTIDETSDSILQLVKDSGIHKKNWEQFVKGFCKVVYGNPELVSGMFRAKIIAGHYNQIRTK